MNTLKKSQHTLKNNKANTRTATQHYQPQFTQVSDFPLRPTEAVQGCYRHPSPCKKVIAKTTLRLVRFNCVHPRITRLPAISQRYCADSQRFVLLCSWELTQTETCVHVCCAMHRTTRGALAVCVLCYASRCLLSTIMPLILTNFDTHPRSAISTSTSSVLTAPSTKTSRRGALRLVAT